MKFETEYGIGDVVYYLGVSDECNWVIIGPSEVDGVRACHYKDKSIIIYLFGDDTRISLNEAFSDEVFKTKEEAEKILKSINKGKIII